MGRSKYRDLKDGEIWQKGDRIKICGTWRRMAKSFFGRTHDSSQHGPVRRKISEDSGTQPTASNSAMVPCPNHRKNEFCYWKRPDRFEQRTCAKDPCRPRHQ